MIDPLKDSRNTSAVVLGVPGPKINGLSMGQAAARRRVERIGVLKVHMAGGPVGLGMRSTVASCPRMLVATPWNHGPRTPGSRTPHSPKPPKQNPVFYKKMLKGQKMFKDYEEREKIKDMTRIHLAICQGKGGPGLVSRYRAKRNHFMQFYPNRRAELREMEAYHIRRVKPTK